MSGQAKPMIKPIVTSKMNVTQGDVVVVPFPYTDRLTEKRRPALVISNNQIAEQHGLVWLVMITSADNKRWADDIDLKAGEAGLSAQSFIRTAKLATIDAGRIVRVAGKIEPATWLAVHAALLAKLT